MGSIATRLRQLGFRPTENESVWKRSLLSQEITVTMKGDGKMEYAWGNVFLTERLRYDCPATSAWLDHHFQATMEWLESCLVSNRDAMDREWANLRKWRLF